MSDKPKTTTTFANFSTFVTAMHIIDPSDSWYIAGGFAAFLHIEKYESKDADWYRTQRELIFPSDIEGSMLSSVYKKLVSTYSTPLYLSIENKKIHIGFDPIETDQWISVQDMLVKVQGANVFNPKSLVTIYQRAANSEKAEKRARRVKMLTTISNGGRIDAVNCSGGEPSMLQQMMMQVALRKAKLDAAEEKKKENT